jgi:adenylosuccinate synthase
VPVTVVVGGQFGSEGKGKVSHFMAQDMRASISVRIGGANSGHTVISPTGETLIFRHLPTAVVLPNIICVLGAGTYIDMEVLLQEIAATGISSDRLYIDPNAVILSEDDKLEEHSNSLGSRIGSTQSGTGSGVCRRVERHASVLLAKDDDRLSSFVRPTVPLMRKHLDGGERVIIEGTQGFGLSLLHSPYYPYVTSRDTTASSFLSEAGLSPLDVDDIVLVLRTFPIRVAGNSGILQNEITWEQISLDANSPHPMIEYTSVTKKVRRVGRFDLEIVAQAIASNRPTRLVLNHVDHIDAACYDGTNFPKKVTDFVNGIESSLGCRMSYLGSSPSRLVRR